MGGRGDEGEGEGEDGAPPESIATRVSLGEEEEGGEEEEQARTTTE